MKFWLRLPYTYTSIIKLLFVSHIGVGELGCQWIGKINLSARYCSKPPKFWTEYIHYMFLLDVKKKRVTLGTIFCVFFLVYTLRFKSFFNRPRWVRLFFQTKNYNFIFKYVRAWTVRLSLKLVMEHLLFELWNHIVITFFSLREPYRGCFWLINFSECWFFSTVTTVSTQ